MCLLTPERLSVLLNQLLIISLKCLAKQRGLEQKRERRSRLANTLPVAS